MSDVLIPFAIDKETEKIVEIGDVTRGRKCGCLCPSCLQGLMARHGKSKAWHFAHDNHTEDKPLKECDLSFGSSCRLYTLQLLFNSQITTLHTPEYRVFNEDRISSSLKISECVTRSHSLTEIEYEKSNSYDVQVEIGNYRFYIFLDYWGRSYPEMPVDDKAGLLLIDLDAIADSFYTHKSRPGLLKELIRELFENTSNNKRWLYHPNENAARVRLQHRINESRGGGLKFLGKPSVKPNPEPTEVLQPVQPKIQRHGRFECAICHIEWRGREFSDVYCPKCKKHHYTRFLS